MTQSEGTSQSASGSTSGGSSSGSRKRTKKKKTTRARRGAGGAATRTRRKTTTTRRRTTTRKATGRGKTATRRPRTTSRKPATGTRRRRTGSAARRRTSRPAGVQGILDDLARRANRAGSTIADLSEGGTDAARRTLGTVSETSRQTIARVRREWDKLDNTRRVEFVAGLLGALAAATAGVRTLTKK